MTAKKHEPALLTDNHQKGGGGHKVPSLHKKLSFAQSSVAQVHEMVPEGDIYEFRQLFWDDALGSQPCFEFRQIQNNDIHYWISVFYKWSTQRLEGKMQVMVDVQELKTLLSLMQSTALGLCKIFDPAGVEMLEERGMSVANQKKVRVNIIEVMTSGVILSKLISQHHKLIFLYGLFDFNGDGLLSEVQFATFLKVFYNSLSAVLSISKSDWPPTEQVKERAATIFKEIDTNSNGSIELDELVNWTIGDNSNSNPNSVFYKLLLKRFSAERFGSSVDMYDEGITNFRLNWQKPRLPKCSNICPVHKTKTGPQCSILSREEVITAKSFYEELRGIGKKAIYAEKTESSGQSLRIPGRSEFQKIVNSAMISLAEKNNDDTFDLTTLLRVLCPCAQARHIKMFLNWCEQHDKYVAMQQNFVLIEKSEESLREHSKKPAVPQEVLNSLEREFKRIGGRGGRLTAQDLSKAWGWTMDEVEEHLEKFDINGDNFIDQLEFMEMMCPPEYRLEMDDVVLGDLFAKWLKTEGDTYRTILHSKDKAADIDEWLQPACLLPPAPEHLLHVWEEAFSSIDRDRSGTIEAKELRCVVSDDCSVLICQLLNKDTADSFTLEDFLAAMSDVHGYSAPPQQTDTWAYDEDEETFAERGALAYDEDD